MVNIEPVEVRRARIMRRLAEQKSPVKDWPATESQIRFIRALLARRKVEPDIRTVLVQEIDDGISGYRARQMIEILRRLPYQKEGSSNGDRKV